MRRNPPVIHSGVEDHIWTLAASGKSVARHRLPQHCRPGPGETTSSTWDTAASACWKRRPRSARTRLRTVNRLLREPQRRQHPARPRTRRIQMTGVANTAPSPWRNCSACAISDGRVRTLRRSRTRRDPIPATGRAENPGGHLRVGIDDHPLAELADLTTVRQPVRQQGARAAEMVLGLLRGSHIDHAVSMPTRLVIRRSTAPPSRQVALVELRRSAGRPVSSRIRPRQPDGQKRPLALIRSFRSR